MFILSNFKVVRVVCIGLYKCSPLPMRSSSLFACDCSIRHELLTTGNCSKSAHYSPKRDSFAYFIQCETGAQRNRNNSYGYTHTRIYSNNRMHLYYRHSKYMEEVKRLQLKHLKLDCSIWESLVNVDVNYSRR